MKTLKITEQTHKKLLAIKVEGGFKTLDQTINHILKWIIPENDKKGEQNEH